MDCYLLPALAIKLSVGDRVQLIGLSLDWMLTLMVYPPGDRIYLQDSISSGLGRVFLSSNDFSQ
jgi:hypothetical protein